MMDRHISQVVLDAVRDHWGTGETEIGSDAVYRHLLRAGASLSPAVMGQVVNELEYRRLIRVDRPFNGSRLEAGSVIITWVRTAGDEPQQGLAAIDGTS